MQRQSPFAARLIRRPMGLCLVSCRGDLDERELSSLAEPFASVGDGTTNSATCATVLFHRCKTTTTASSAAQPGRRGVRGAWLSAWDGQATGFGRPRILRTAEVSENSCGGGSGGGTPPPAGVRWLSCRGARFFLPGCGGFPAGVPGFSCRGSVFSCRVSGFSCRGPGFSCGNPGSFHAELFLPSRKFPRLFPVPNFLRPRGR